MSLWIKSTMPHLGLDFEEKPVRVINREAVAHNRGDVMQFDTFRKSPSTVNALFGNPGSCWVNVVDPDFQPAGTFGGQAFAVVCVLLEPIGPGLEGMAMLWSGSIEIMSTADAVVAGDLGAINANLSNALEFMGGGTSLNAASKGVAVAQAASAGGVLVPCLFNGFHFWAKV